MANTRSSLTSQDTLEDVPEPWRRVRLSFRAELKAIMKGYVPPKEMPSKPVTAP